MKKGIRGLVAGLGFPLTVWNMVMNEKSRVLPPGMMVHTETSDTHVISEGEGPVTIVLEAGFSSISLDWLYVQPELARHARVIAYDRGNYGWSRSKRKSRTILDSAEELHEVLSRMEAKPPYILVGHSYGGLIIRLFASLYPNEVAGLILEDAAHEHYYLPTKENVQRLKKFQRILTFGFLTSWVGLPRLMKQRVGRNELNEESSQALNYIGYRPKSFLAAYEEYQNAEKSARIINESQPLQPSLPVIVISANHPSEHWQEYQELLAKLTPCTEQVFADTGHSVHLENPDLIVRKVLELIQQTSHRSQLHS
ncbi:alpha/beta fold hydrolase [Halobacillus sp. Nhm2S1]|uniref:alpha/beta fold hydrolase n=1 Tax=Halobacillus sp. Nhm2S1 TaxID=2866716 RepID=UPI001C72D53E|nr:alpha/beta hydrolase [Halobacillus sp. Nhm2S1]MBX0358612.1 alpha/beta hydrolase [Halobacillus sp. Nhm2S1]